MISGSISLILFNSYRASSDTKSFENRLVIDFWSVSRIYFSTLPSITFVSFSFELSIAFVYLSKGFLKKEEVNLACSIIWLWLEGNISSPGKNSI